MRYFVVHPVVNEASGWTIVEENTEDTAQFRVLSGEFSEIYPEFLKRYHANPIFIDSINDEQKWNQYIDDLGYAPLADRYYIDWKRFAKILIPRLAKITHSELMKWAMNSDPYYNQEDPSNRDSYIIRRLLDVLGSLPLITLQSMVDCYPGWTGFQEIMNEWILLRMKDEGEREKSVKVLHELAFKQALRGFVSDPVSETMGSDSNFEVHEAIPDPFDDYCLDVFVEQTRSWPGELFEERPGQKQMIKSVASALSDDQLLIIEAGTGTGKSLAYLLPSAIFSKRSGEIVLIATHTIALQEQLRNKDLPLLNSLLKEPLNVAVLKGRNHYLCLRKVSRNLRNPGELTDQEKDFILKVAVWITETEAGDREEIALPGREQESWRLVQSETESCINKKCPFFKDCYYFAARQKASEANLVLANHSLVLSDLATDHRILPNYQRLILDEAHHLEEQATNQLGAEVYQYDLQKKLERISGSRGVLPELRRTLSSISSQHDGESGKILRQVEQLERLTNQAASDLKSLWSALERWSQYQRPKSELRIVHEVVESEPYSNIKDSGNWLYETRKQLVQSHTEFDQLRQDIEVEDPLFDRLEDASVMIRELYHGLEICVDVVLCRLSQEEYVGWVSVKDTATRMSLQLAPLSVARILKRELFDDLLSVVLTSATLSVAGSFSYIKERTGLGLLKETGRVVEHQLNSPFSYKQQALLCVPIDMPDVRTEKAFSQSAANAIEQIAKLSEGRTLVLFTARHMLQEVYQLVHKPLENQGINLIAQGIHDHRRTQLLEQFKTTARTVLFGLDSFWEGVDVQGDALTSLVIVKLPFPVPTHPIVEARSEMIRQAGKHPFREYSIPLAVIRFTQGFGRLIRAQTDRGVVFVLDKRIVTETYGKVFLRSLPNVPVLQDTFANTCKAAKQYF